MSKFNVYFMTPALSWEEVNAQNKQEAIDLCNEDSMMIVDDEPHSWLVQKEHVWKLNEEENNLFTVHFMKVYLAWEDIEAKNKNDAIHQCDSNTLDEDDGPHSWLVEKQKN